MRQVNVNVNISWQGKHLELKKYKCENSSFINDFFLFRTIISKINFKSDGCDHISWQGKHLKLEKYKCENSSVENEASGAEKMKICENSDKI